MADYEEQNWNTGDTFTADDATAMSHELEEQEQKDVAQDASIADLATAVNNKVDKIVTPTRVYIVNDSGITTVGLYSSSPTGTAFVRRDASGRSQFSDPAAAADAATKGYVDSKFNLPFDFIDLNGTKYGAALKIEANANGSDSRVQIELVKFAGSQSPDYVKLSVGMRSSLTNLTPYIDLQILDSKGVTPEQIIGVLTENTSSKQTLVVHIYTPTFGTWTRRIASLATDNTTAVSLPVATELSALPAGNQYIANASRPKITEIIGNAAGGEILNTGVQPIPLGAVGVRVRVIPPGSGGGSGRRGAPGTVRCGGGGAASTPWAPDTYFPVSPGGTWLATIYPAGVGGVAVTTDNTDGNSGEVNSSRHALFKLSGVKNQQHRIYANAQLYGSGGTVISGFGGISYIGIISGNSGANATPGGIGGNAANVQNGAGAGAGAGGSISNNNIAFNGGNGGYDYIHSIVPVATSAGGIVDGVLPSRGETVTNGLPGNGPGGGAASITQAAQAGADGVAYGSGGGGGGASTNGFASGRGGNGAPGYILLEWVYG